MECSAITGEKLGFVVPGNALAWGTSEPEVPRKTSASAHALKEKKTPRRGPRTRIADLPWQFPLPSVTLWVE